MYHRVATLTSDVHHLCITPDAFRSHMSELRRHHRPTGLSELADALAAGALPPGAVAVTFDDGSLDNLTIASGILQQFDIPATFFIPTERLHELREYWWDTLERIFVSTRNVPASLELPGGNVYATGTRDERLATHAVISEMVRRLEAEPRDAMVAQLCEWAGGDFSPRDSHRPVLPEELRALCARPGHQIGAHTVRHLRLPGLSAAEKWREMFENKLTLEAFLGIDVTALAYPYGELDQETLDVARDLFAVAVTVTPEAVRPNADPLALPRIDASQLSADELARRLSSLFSGADITSGRC